jgi:hypothetical protein
VTEDCWTCGRRGAWSSIAEQAPFVLYFLHVLGMAPVCAGWPSQYEQDAGTRVPTGCKPSRVPGLRGLLCGVAGPKGVIISVLVPALTRR